MVTKAGPIMKHLVKGLKRWPPENIAPWKAPNKKAQKIIDAQLVGRMERTVIETQTSILAKHLKKHLR